MPNVADEDEEESSEWDAEPHKINNMINSVIIQ